MSGEGTGAFGSAEEVPEEVRPALADLLLVLADTKRVLGMRYSDWILGAPALEAGIACSAMAQDEWGHGRILYAMLEDFGEDADELEHGREPSEYRSCELLDEAPETWPELLALNLLLDTAVSVQFDAMKDSRFEPFHHKARKLLDEERYHFEHGKGWTLRLASSEKGREALAGAFPPAWEGTLRWFGRQEDEANRRLVEAGIVEAGPDELRERWLARVAPVAGDAGLELAEEDGGGWASALAPDWTGWVPERRRTGDAPGPDEETIRRVRGDKNRALLLD